MARRIPQDPNCATTCPAAIKAKITALENAAYELGMCAAHGHPAAGDFGADAQWRRYCLEQTILTCIEAAVAAALDTNTKRTR